MQARNDAPADEARALAELHGGLPVLVQVPARGPVPGTLTTDHARSSHGQPVLVLPGLAGMDYPEEAVAYGPLDPTRWGPAIHLRLEPLDEAPELLEVLTAWKRLRRLARFAAGGGR